MATSRSLLRWCFITLTPILPALFFSFTKQDLTVNWAYYVSSVWFVLFNEPKLWQLTLVFSAFYRLFLETTSFYTTPIGQIIPCHVTKVKILRYLGLLNDDPRGPWWAQVSAEFYSNTLQSRNLGVKSVGTKTDIWEKCTLSFFQEGLSI